MIPYFSVPPLQVGPASLDAFSALVVSAILVGLAIGRRRYRAVGLDPIAGESLMWHAIVIGLVVSHVVDVIAYHPEVLRRDPMELLRVWGSLSSLAGMLGGLAGMAVFFARHPELTPSKRLAYVDVIAFAFPFAWVLGRLGCTLTADHPGALTSAPLATSLASPESRAFIRSAYEAAGLAHRVPADAALAGLGFHNLGFYELLYTLVVLIPMMVALGRAPRPPGTFLLAFVLAYAPLRFFADFLRVGDRTYASLTFAQIASLTMTVVAVGAVLVRARRRATQTESSGA